MKRSEPTLDDQIRSIHYKYEIPQDKAEALLSLAARKKSEKWKPWAEARLGISPEDFTKWIAETRNPSLPKK